MSRRHLVLLAAVAGGIVYGVGTAIAGWPDPVGHGLIIFTSVLVGAALVAK